MDTTATPKSSGLIQNLLREVQYPDAETLLNDPETFPQFFGEGHYEAINLILQVVVDTLLDDVVRLVGPTLDARQDIINNLDSRLTEARQKIDTTKEAQLTELQYRLNVLEKGYADRGTEIDRLNQRLYSETKQALLSRALAMAFERQFDEACAEADRLDDELTLATAVATELSEEESLFVRGLIQKVLGQIHQETMPHYTYQGPQAHEPIFGYNVYAGNSVVR